MANKKYLYVGSHADTLCQDDKCIPVGHGMEPIAISDADFEDERNAHLKDSFVAVSEVAQDVKEAKAGVAAANDTDEAGKAGEK